MKVLRISKPDRSIKGTIKLPFSKSISNRLLIISGLTEEKFAINNLSDSGDTLLLERLLQEILQQKDPNRLTEIDASDAGTVMRFLVAFLSMRPGKWVLTGTSRMKHRPIGVLVDGLKPLGADIEYLSALGYPPVLIKGKKLVGKEIVVDPGISSQFISALIMIGPVLPGGLRMHIAGPPVSQPYIDMTIRLLKYFGIDVVRQRSYIIIPEKKYIARDITVEADWSSAAFWYETAALSKDADLLLEGLTRESMQGDAVVAEIFDHLGVETRYLSEGVRLTKKKISVQSFSYNFTDHPDIAPAVITTCAMLGIPCNFEGLNTLRIKESDRLQGLYNELAGLGFDIGPDPAENQEGRIEIRSSMTNPGKEMVFRSYGDHRMAMTFAPLSMVFGHIQVQNPDVVIKSYPSYWKDLAANGFDISEPVPGQPNK